jgi:peroxiredoxin Q/BCP
MSLPLQPGSRVPSIALPSTEGKHISLDEFKDKKRIVLYFYPEDDTPSCTKEACAFRDDIHLYQMKDSIILGVSTDPLDSHLIFKQKYTLPFTLLSDMDAVMSRAFGVYDEEAKEARRVTFIIGKDGIIQKVFDNVKVARHAEEVLNALPLPQS